MSNFYLSLSEASSDKPYVTIMNPYMVVPNGAALPVTNSPDWCGISDYGTLPSPNKNLGRSGTVEGLWRYNRRTDTTVCAEQHATLNNGPDRTYFPS